MKLLVEVKEYEVRTSHVEVSRINMKEGGGERRKSYSIRRTYCVLYFTPMANGSYSL